MSATAAWYALACAQLGARPALRLLEVFQQPEAIFDATPSEWAARARLSASGCTRLLEAANRKLDAELPRLERLGIRLLDLYHAEYPAWLRSIADPPPVLFIKGELQPADQQAIAMVGSRRASPYGRHVASELAAALAGHGFTVVSGMALGADAAAHEGCLRAGGRTIAVLGSGIDVVYPPEHLALYERIAAAGAVLSEYPPGAPPTRSSFPVRNRIISGLALGVLVVEAPEKSGALITAAHALEQGREVFAVPGSVNSIHSRGSHQLLRDGARLVESVDDILEELSWQLPSAPRVVTPQHGPSWSLVEGMRDETPSAPATPAAPVDELPTPRRRKNAAALSPTPSADASPAPMPALPREEQAVLGLLSTTAKHVDAIIEASHLSPAQVNAVLLMLELKGFAQRRPGNAYIRLR